MLPGLQGKGNCYVSRLLPCAEVVGRGINLLAVKDDLAMLQGTDFQMRITDLSLYFESISEGDRGPAGRIDIQFDAGIIFYPVCVFQVAKEDNSGII